MAARANGRDRKTPRKNGRRRTSVETPENGAASIIERTRVSLAPMRGRAGGSKGRSRNLDFSVQRQMHSNWCWVAVATSVAHYYNPQSRWTQCAVANRELGRKDCCGKSSKCNITGHLKDSLALVRHAERHPELKSVGRISFSRVQREIDAGRPLGVRTQWRGGAGAHVLVVVGYHREFELLSLEDPLFGSSHWHYQAFWKDYRHSGQWKNSYYTKP